MDAESIKQMNEIETERILVKPETAAKMIEVSRAKMYRMLAAGLIEKVTLPGGRLIRVPLDAILKISQPE
jgi:predicted site-specific integrase-resolvase